jgi:POT family proton-dependent oligopeptide transporter
LAPAGFGATTVAAWFLAIFSGSFAAGAVGALWTGMAHGLFFLLLAVIATLAAAMLFALDRATQRVEALRAAETDAISAI